MDFVSIKFLIFVILTTTAYFVVPRRNRWTVLLAASLWFYYGTGKRALVTMIAVSLFTFIFGIVIERSYEYARLRKIQLAIPVITIVGWLAATKIPAVQEQNYYFIVVPLGVSYVTFSLISYLVDIYWERGKAEKNYFRFLLYVLFFPKISQGPISRYHTFSSRLFSGGCLSYEKICFGCQRMLYGYLKKSVIADRSFLITNSVFSSVEEYSGSIIVAAAVLAVFELYCDFSGYMDIVIGFCEMLGMELDENFQHPFFSRSAAEFWRRWHITLGTWFRDYVYTPVVMSRPVKNLGKWGRKKVSRRFGNSITKTIALSAVWLLTGMWHGTGINYVIWGIMWGSIIIFSAIFSEKIEIFNKLLHINTQTLLWKIFQMMRTFMIFCFGVMLTRLDNLMKVKAAMWNILWNFNIRDLFSRKLCTANAGILDLAILLLGMCMVLCISIVQERCNIRRTIASFHGPVRWVIYAAAISFVVLFGMYGTGYSTSGFAYMYF